MRWERIVAQGTNRGRRVEGSKVSRGRRGTKEWSLFDWTQDQVGTDALESNGTGRCRCRWRWRYAQGARSRRGTRHYVATDMAVGAVLVLSRMGCRTFCFKGTGHTGGQDPDEFWIVPCSAKPEKESGLGVL